MAKKKRKVEFRYYEMPEKEKVLALLGEDWIREYGEGIECLHFHNYIEIGICHYGTGEVVLDEKHYKFQGNEIVIIPPNLPHITNSTPGTKGFWEWMYFDMEKVISRIYPKDVVRQKNTIQKLYQRPFFVQFESQKILVDVLTLIKQEMRNKRAGYRYSVDGLLQAFAIEVLRMQDEEERYNLESQRKAIITPAIEYVEEHFQEEIKIISLADTCNISESHFRRIFLESMNMKPNDFVNMVRVQKACDYLGKTELPMEDIAYLTGFANVSTFNRNFKKFLDISPLQWKKSEENVKGKLLNYKISAQKGW